MIFRLLIKNKIFYALIVLLFAVLLFANAASYRDLEYYGFCKRITDKTVIVSVFADDKETSFYSADRKLDAKKIDEIAGYLDIACDYIKKECLKYGKVAELIYKNDSDLMQQAHFDTKLSGLDRDTTLLDEYIYSEKSKRTELLKKYNSHSILYLFFVNSDSKNDNSSACYMWTKEGDPEDEFCVINTTINEKTEGPAAYAHEMLHAFGAIDLYPNSTTGYGISIPECYVNQVDKNDIMFSVYDISTDGVIYDKITNSMSELDAYYLGIVSRSDSYDSYGLGYSIYDNKAR